MLQDIWQEAVQAFNGSATTKAGIIAQIAMATIVHRNTPVHDCQPCSDPTESEIICQNVIKKHSIQILLNLTFLP